MLKRFFYFSFFIIFLFAHPIFASSLLIPDIAEQNKIAEKRINSEVKQWTETFNAKNTDEVRLEINRLSDNLKLPLGKTTLETVHNIYELLNELTHRDADILFEETLGLKIAEIYSNNNEKIATLLNSEKETFKRSAAPARENAKFEEKRQTLILIHEENEKIITLLKDVSPEKKMHLLRHYGSQAGMILGFAGMGFIHTDHTMIQKGAMALTFVFVLIRQLKLDIFLAHHLVSEPIRKKFLAEIHSMHRIEASRLKAVLCERNLMPKIYDEEFLDAQAKNILEQEVEQEAIEESSTETVAPKFLHR